MSVEAVEAVEVVEATEAERAFAQLEHLYAQLPAMEEKGAALARARSAAEVDGLAKTAAYRATELARAESLVARAEACVREAEAALVRLEGVEGDAAEKAAELIRDREKAETMLLAQRRNASPEAARIIVEKVTEQ